MVAFEYFIGMIMASSGFSVSDPMRSSIPDTALLTVEGRGRREVLRASSRVVRMGNISSEEVVFETVSWSIEMNVRQNFSDRRWGQAL